VTARLAQASRRRAHCDASSRSQKCGLHILVHSTLRDRQSDQLPDQNAVNAGAAISTICKTQPALSVLHSTKRCKLSLCSARHPRFSSTPCSKTRHHVLRGASVFSLDCDATRVHLTATCADGEHTARRITHSTVDRQAGTCRQSNALFHIRCCGACRSVALLIECEIKILKRTLDIVTNGVYMWMYVDRNQWTAEAKPGGETTAVSKRSLIFFTPK
jgi:hypothetical protein